MTYLTFKIYKIMKQKISLVMVMFILMNGYAYGQSATNTLLEKAVSTLDNARSVDEWKEARGIFERLSSVDPQNWLPLYYLAYTDITLSFQVEDEKKKSKYLTEAEDYLNQLKKLKISVPEESSEISTLRGYWYYAQMAINPGTNGPKYAGIITGCYKEALISNENNPRAILLNALFQKSMASFINGNYPEYENDLKRAKDIFDLPVTNPVFPHWGAYFLGNGKTSSGN